MKINYSFLAMNNEVDPTPVVLIEEFKAALAQQTAQMEGKR